MSGRLTCSGRGLFAFIALMISALGGGRAPVADTPARASDGGQACYRDALVTDATVEQGTVDAAVAVAAPPQAPTRWQRPSVADAAVVVPTLRRGRAGGPRAP